MGTVNKIRWWTWIRWPWRRWSIVLIVEAADEVPERLPWRGAVLVGTRAYPKWLAFDCPCGSGHRIVVTLDRGHKPHWKVTATKQLSVVPSIDYCGGGRRCHYFISNGKTVWAHDIGGDHGRR